MATEKQRDQQRRRARAHKEAVARVLARHPHVAAEIEHEFLTVTAPKYGINPRQVSRAEKREQVIRRLQARRLDTPDG